MKFLFYNSILKFDATGESYLGNYQPKINTGNEIIILNHKNSWNCAIQQTKGITYMLSYNLMIARFLIRKELEFSASPIS